MPAAVSYPGVYIEEIPSGVRTITGVPTSITAFVGRTQWGPVNEPTLVESFADFETQFGGMAIDYPLTYALNDYFANGGSQAVIVRLCGAPAAGGSGVAQLTAGGLKLNASSPGNWGNSVGVIVDTNNISPDVAAQYGLQVADLFNLGVYMVDTSGNWTLQERFLNLTVKYPDAGVPVAARALRVDRVLSQGSQYVSVPFKQDGVTPDLPAQPPAPTAPAAPAPAAGQAAAGQAAAGQAAAGQAAAGQAAAGQAAAGQAAAGQAAAGQAAAGQAAAGQAAAGQAAAGQAAAGQAAAGQAAAGQAAAGQAAAGQAAAAPAAAAGPIVPVQAAGGGESVGLQTLDYLPADQSTQTGIFALLKADIFNLLCIPPDIRSGDTDPQIFSQALGLCVTRRAMLIVDSPAAWSANVATAANRAKAGLAGLGLSGINARNAALYFPRVIESDPLSQGQSSTFAPCGIIAGIMARTDAQRGVWKAPAGLDASLNGILGFDATLKDGDNGILNPLGINCLRSFPPVNGMVVWGARTLRGADQLADDYKYVPVRRLALYLEESLYRGTQWVVFEPNDEPLWAQIRLNVGAFMHDLFVQGAFQGSTPTSAYFVKCDSETTTQNDINLGVVNIVVGYAPLKPAEFVVIQIQQMAGQIAT